MKKIKVPCTACRKDNCLSAKYCAYCGEEINESFSKDAYKKSVYRKLEIIDKIYNVVTLSFITGNIWFRLIFLSVLIVVGVAFNFVGRNQFTVKDTKDYDVVYDRTADKYIVQCDTKDGLNLNLKVPKGTETITIDTYTKDGELVETKECELSKEIPFNDIKTSIYKVSAGDKSINIEFSYRGDDHE